MDGKSIWNTKDSNGNTMCDGYLVDEAAKNHPWVIDVYEKP